MPMKVHWMIEVEISVEPIWGNVQDWQSISEQAIAAALAIAPFTALTHTGATVSVSVRFAENDEVQKLNRDYRHKDAATNILSFPMVQADMLDSIANTDDGELLLGDMILAHAICAQETVDKDIPLAQHISHLIVHGTLHLLGFDHTDEVEAERMEAMEVKALASMGIANPYSAK